MNRSNHLPIESLPIRILLALAALLSWYWMLKYSAPYGTIGSDFVQDYSAAKAYLAGLPIYGSSIGTIAAQQGMSWGVHDFENFHPPFLAVISLPFTVFPVDTAFVVWNTVLAACYCISGVLLVRAGVMSPSAGLIILAAIPFWAPGFSTLCLGQVNPLMLLLLTIAWRCWRSPRHSIRWLAGVALGITSLIKMFPAFFILLLLIDRRWSSVLAFMITCLGGITLCVALFGTASVATYATTIIARDVAEWSNFLINHSIHGVLGRVFSETTHVRPLADLPLLGFTAALALKVVVLLCTITYLKRSSTESSRADLRFWSQLIPMFLLSPITWQHSLVLTIPLFVVAFNERLISQELRVALLIGLVTFSVLDLDVARWLVEIYSHKIPWYVAIGMINIPFFGLLLTGYRIFRERPSGQNVEQ